MTIYYIMILVLMGLGYVLTEQKKENRMKIGYLVLVFLVFTFFASFRYAIGFDYFSYRAIYEKMAKWTFGDILSRYWYEPFFFLFCKFFSLCGCSFTGFLVGIHCFLFFVAVRFFYQESKMIWVSVYLYITLQFLAYNMNLVRQSIAIAFFLLAYPYLKNRKILPYSIWIGLGGLFHNSLFFIYPFYFLLPKNYTRKFLGILILLVLGAYCFCDPMLQVLLPFLPGRYGDYQGSYFWNSNGFEYVIPSLVYGILVYRFRERIADSVWRAIYLNSALYHFLISLFITKHFILERFSIYPFALSLIVVPEMIDSYKQECDRGSRRYYYVLALFLIFGGAYFFFAVAKGYHHVYPYVSLLKRSYSSPNSY